MPGGFIFSITLLSYLVNECRCNIRLIELNPGENKWDRNLINGKRILLLDSLSSKGETLKKIRGLIRKEGVKVNIRLKEIKTFVYGDFSGFADYCIYQPKYEDRLNSFQIYLL